MKFFDSTGLENAKGTLCVFSWIVPPFSSSCDAGSESAINMDSARMLVIGAGVNGSVCAVGLHNAEMT